MPELRLGEQVLDKGIVSTDPQLCGEVDDLLLSWDERDPSQPPIVEGILTGPIALAHYWPAPFVWLARRVYGLLGVSPAEPICVPWDWVKTIGVVVALNKKRGETELSRIDDAIRRRFIEPLPGA